MATTVAVTDAVAVGLVEPLVDTQPVRINAEQTKAPAAFNRRAFTASRAVRIGYPSSPRSTVPPPGFPYVGFPYVGFGCVAVPFHQHLGDQHRDQRQAEHIVWNPEPRIAVKHQGSWEHDQKMSDQKPLPSPAALRALAPRHEDRRHHDGGKKSAIDDVRRPHEPAETSIRGLRPRNAGDPQIRDVARDNLELAGGICLHAPETLP